MLRTISAIAIAICTVAFAGAAYASWFEDETPPANAKPLSVIIKSLEDRGYKTISEVEFEDGKWEVEVHQANGKEMELHVDPINGLLASE
ncbi:MAG TPA: PepSY domain-containing protein [Rhizomicrobium sp.]|jgi:hypothetical protein|nr:PepSY domain-containing protein [Rhizomicrobium sp.]